MNSRAAFPHDETYDADFANGEIFNAKDDLARFDFDPHHQSTPNPFDTAFSPSVASVPSVVNQKL